MPRLTDQNAAEWVRAGGPAVERMAAHCKLIELERVTQQALRGVEQINNEVVQREALIAAATPSFIAADELNANLLVIRRAIAEVGDEAWGANDEWLESPISCPAIKQAWDIEGSNGMGALAPGAYGFAVFLLGTAVLVYSWKDLVQSDSALWLKSDIISKANRTYNSCIFGAQSDEDREACMNAYQQQIAAGISVLGKRPGKAEGISSAAVVGVALVGVAAWLAWG